MTMKWYHGYMASNEFIIPRYKKGTDPKKHDLERFNALTVRPTNPDLCWKWKGRLWSGYPSMWSSEKKNGVLAHRWSYEHFVGPIPKGLTVDHQCNNPQCTNPKHLKPMTQYENNYRSPSFTGNRTHCPRGHEYTPENTYTPPGGKNIRDCRKCISRRAAEYKIRKGERPNRGMYKI